MYLQHWLTVRGSGHGRQDAVQCGGGGGGGPDIRLQAAPVPQKLQQTHVRIADTVKHLNVQLAFKGCLKQNTCAAASPLYISIGGRGGFPNSQCILCEYAEKSVYVQ